MITSDGELEDDEERDDDGNAVIEAVGNQKDVQRMSSTTSDCRGGH